MKTILVNVNSGFFSRNFLLTEAPEIFAGAKDVRLGLLAPESKLDYMRQKFPAPFIVWDALPDVSGLTVEKIFRFIERSCIHTRTSTYMHYNEFHRAGSQDMYFFRLVRFFARRCLWFLGQFRFFREFLRYLYRSWPTGSFSGVFSKYSPDLVFCPTLMYH